MHKDNMYGRSLWAWRSIVGGVCIAAALVIAFGMRGPTNPTGWPEWLVFPGVTLDIVGGILVYTEWREVSL